MDGKSTFAKKYHLEAEIRGTRQGGRKIREFHDVMVGLWDQLAKLEAFNLRKLSTYKKDREERRLVQFLIALRDEFEPLRESMLCRSLLPSVEEAVSELAAEEMRLKSSAISSKNKQLATVDLDSPQYKFSTLSPEREDNFQIGKYDYDYDYDYIGGIDSERRLMQKQSPKYSKPSSSQAMSVLSSMPETDESDLMGGLTGTMLKVAMASFAVAGASFAVAGVSRAIYNYYTEPEETRIVKILSYNVWSQKKFQLKERMEALGDLIRFHSPDVICFQEVTPYSYEIFEKSDWWSEFRCSVLHEMVKKQKSFCMQLSKLPVNSMSFIPLRNSKMGREICIAEVEVCENKPPLIVASSHLKSPGSAHGDMFSKERVAQAKEALNHLKNSPNVIFCGDMNWDDDLDGRFPMSRGWVDAWAKLRPWESGWTFDTESNPMLFDHKPLQKRLDRFICNLQGFKLKDIDMVGKKAIPGPSFRGGPVLVSDHYGLLLEVQCQ